MAWSKQKTWVDLVPKYRIAGAEQTRRVIDKRTIVGPASYVADGFAVDLSGVLASLDQVNILRAFVTATKAPDSRVFEVNEVGTDTFANRKFRIKAFRAPTPAGTNDAPAVTTDANVVKATGALANVAATETGAAASCGSVACDAAHPGSVVAQRTNLLQGSGAAKVTAVLTVPAAAFTGTAPTGLKTEVAATTDLSTITVEYEVIGEPA